MRVDVRVPPPVEAREIMCGYAAVAALEKVAVRVTVK